jgi:predicted NAD/FAD-dependent oxidoreductase
MAHNPVMNAIFPLDPHPGVLVVGAGIAGLACARDLAHRGIPVTLLDRGRGVGGRCATRRVDGQPVDHGVAFLHGSDPAFLDALHSVPGATLLEGWPSRVEGTGAPCQPDAFAPNERRVAFAEGVTAFPKMMVAGLDARLVTTVVGLHAEDDLWRLDLAGGGTARARTVVLAMATEETLALVDGLPPGDLELEGARHLLRMVAASVPCLTVIAGYPTDVPAPAWDVAFPETSSILKDVVHDSAKRQDPRWTVLVIQAAARWSRQHAGEPVASWTQSLLSEGARLYGEWVAHPAWTQVRHWQFGRIESGNELSGPLVVEGAGGRTLGIAGEVFAEGGGVQAAWTSGRLLAARLAERTIG